MKHYEIMYILKSSLEEAARQETMNSLSAIITADGTIDNVDEWGMKEFAYKIEDMTKGYYVVIKATTTAAAVKEFDRICRINANVVRHMIVNQDE